MIRLIVTRSARADISKTLDYLENEAGRRTADSYSARFRDAIIRLGVFPASGAPRPALGESTRMLVVYPYVMLYDYQPSGDLLTVLRVLHGKTAITEKVLRRV